MIENKVSAQLGHPWRDGEASPPPEAAALPAIAVEPPKERSVFGLAAELKNLIRDDRVYRSQRTAERTRNQP